MNNLHVFSTQEIVPAHLVTSPIPTQEVLFRSREPRCGGSASESGQPISPEDLQLSSNSAGKKKKRRRRKHKAEPRKDEQTPAGGELELCELSSDEEQNTHNGRWADPFALKSEFNCI